MTNADSLEERKPNRLINEKSPYLLQHANNAVDWYPWGDEAFRKAKTENKPIFLSIGYSSCHWCHVMAHESFEDKDVAKFLNENFVSIKVDREERPDVDEVYMKAVMSMTGSGGWPLTVFLTPSLEPFFGGTYFPLTPKYGMPSFLNVAKGISGSWRTERKNVVESASRMKQSLVELYDFRKDPNSKIDATVIGDCFDSLASSYDDRFGGFGDAPKFPTPSNLLFLMRYFAAESNKLALNMVAKTLDSMMNGGIYDQVGGGFHRYSTDRYWLVPHFEKMLYDNALLAQVYLEAFLITKNQEYANVAEETLAWAMREMRSECAGFYSALDADSPEGEGSFYVWTPAELRDALKGSSLNADEFLKYFSITSDGNFEQGRTILTAKSRSLIAREFGMSEKDFEYSIFQATKLMLEFRNRRPRPSTDDKILFSWNGLMISALSKASYVLGDEKYLKAAAETADFLLKASIREGGVVTLPRSYRQEARGEGVLEDYAFVANGLIDLYEASFNTRYLEEAIALCGSMISKFHDTTGGGFYLTESKTLIVRPKDAYDGATPSGNSIAALVCARLAEFTGRDTYRNAANDTIESFWKIIVAQPFSFTAMLIALQFLRAKTKEVIFSGDLASGEMKALLSKLRTRFMPNSILIHADAETQKLTSLVEDKILSNDEKAKAFVCTGFACKLPSSTPQELNEALNG